jgi:preprotein translocase subunit YajC
VAKFSHGDEVVILETKIGDLKDLCGMKAMVIEVLPPQNVNDYLIQVEQTKEEVRVRESEINRFDSNDYLYQIKKGDTVVRKNGTEVKVSMIDYVNRQIEIKYPDDTYEVVSIDVITGKYAEGDETVEEDIYEHILITLLGQYKNEDNTYTVPKELLVNMISAIYKEGE